VESSVPLPSKSYYSCDEIAERWNTNRDDLLVFAMDGLLELSVLLIGREIELGSLVDGRKVKEEVKTFTCPLPAYPEDLWRAMKGGAASIGRFKTAHADRYAVPANESRRWPMWDSSVVITREERDRFERTHNLTPDVKEARATDFSHSSDYSIVTLSGRTFQLGALQAGMVRMLHAATRTGDGWVSGRDLLDEVRSASTYIGHVFKSQHQWQQLIQSDGRGKYRLNMPGSDRATKRLFRSILNRSYSPDSAIRRIQTPEWPSVRVTT
jgi:hypothetical protein